MPRLDRVMTQLSIVTLRIPAMLPSQNLTALDAERQAAVRHRDVLAGLGRAEPIHGIEDQGVVARLDGAVGDADVLAAVGVDAVGPDAVLEARPDGDAVDDQAFALDRVHGPGRGIQEGDAGDADVRAADEEDQLAVLVGLREGPVERQAELLHLDLVRADEVVLVVALEPPVVGPLAVEDAAPLDGHAREVLAVEEGLLVEAGLVVDGVDGRPGLHVEPHVAAEVDGPARVAAGREEDRSPARLGAGVDGLLDGFLGQVLFDPGRPEIPDVKDRAGRDGPVGRGGLFAARRERKDTENGGGRRRSFGHRSPPSPGHYHEPHPVGNGRRQRGGCPPSRGWTTIASPGRPTDGVQDLSGEKPCRGEWPAPILIFPWPKPVRTPGGSSMPSWAGRAPNGRRSSNTWSTSPCASRS